MKLAREIDWYYGWFYGIPVYVGNPQTGVPVICGRNGFYEWLLDAVPVLQFLLNLGRFVIGLEALDAWYIKVGPRRADRK